MYNSLKFVQNALRNLSLVRKMPYYAVAQGHKVGVYDTWGKCEEQVKGFKGAKYKKFQSREEAECFIKDPSSAGTVASGSSKSQKSKFRPQDIAIALGKKGATQTGVVWPKDEVPIEATEKLEKKDIESFWPEDDSFKEGPIRDEELLAVMAEVESTPPTADSKPDVSKRKRKSGTKATTSRKLFKHASKIWEPVGVQNIGDYEFQIDEEGFVIVYTDGSCIKNGQANASAGFGVYFGDEHPLNAGKPVLGRVTNNVGEIQAAIHAIKVAKEVGIPKLCISTDSQFLINAITLWISTWKKKNWTLKDGKPVKNVADFKELDDLLQANELIVKWNYVKAHKGIEGNERADKLAREGSSIYKRSHSI